MPSVRFGTTGAAAKTRRSPRATPRAIELCQSHGLASVAFPAISTGVYRFPADRASRIAVATTLEALQAAPAVSRVIFCCFSDESAALHAQAMAEYGAPCPD